MGAGWLGFSMHCLEGYFETPRRAIKKFEEEEEEQSRKWIRGENHKEFITYWIRYNAFINIRVNW